jgi:hypothetical protein
MLAIGRIDLAVQDAVALKDNTARIAERGRLDVQRGCANPLAPRREPRRLGVRLPADATV